VTARDEDPQPVYGRVEREFFAELDACRARGLDSGLASRAAQWFDARKHAAFDGRHKVVGRHCDFAPYNVLVSGEQVTVIDFEGLQGGILYDDLCYFLAHVEATPGYHLGRRMKASLREDFLGGYARRGRVDRAQFDFFMLAAMVKVMAHSPVLVGDASLRARVKRGQRLRFYSDWFGERLS
jgi:Ser/Thr protein kinase RdoA (MazF antagonist)